MKARALLRRAGIVAVSATTLVGGGVGLLVAEAGQSSAQVPTLSLDALINEVDAAISSLVGATGIVSQLDVVVAETLGTLAGTVLVTVAEVDAVISEVVGELSSVEGLLSTGLATGILDSVLTQLEGVISEVTSLLSSLSSGGAGLGSLTGLLTELLDTLTGAVGSLGA